MVKQILVYDIIFPSGRQISISRILDFAVYISLTSMFLLPVTSAPSHLQSCSCRHPWSSTGQSLWSWSLHKRCHSPTGCYLNKEMFSSGLNAFKIVLAGKKRARTSVILARRPTGFQVVVDDGRSDLVEVLEGVNYLHDDGASLLLWHELVLLQVEVQVIALAVLQDCAEPARKQRRATVQEE